MAKIRKKVSAACSPSLAPNTSPSYAATSPPPKKRRRRARHARNRETPGCPKLADHLLYYSGSQIQDSNEMRGSLSLCTIALSDEKRPATVKGWNDSKVYC